MGALCSRLKKKNQCETQESDKAALNMPAAAGPDAADIAAVAEKIDNQQKADPVAVNGMREDGGLKPAAPVVRDDDFSDLIVTVLISARLSLARGCAQL